MLTTKKMPFKTLLHELLWFISGSDSVEYLHEHNIKYWDGFLHEGSDSLGRVYGVQWRHWRRPDGTEFDQLQWAIDEIKNNPDILFEESSVEEYVYYYHTQEQLHEIKKRLKMKEIGKLV